MKRLLLGLFFALAVFPQPTTTLRASRWAYVGGDQVTGTSMRMTLQIPTMSSNHRRARVLLVDVSCPSSVCTAQTIIGGTAASATAVTAVRTRTEAPATPAATLYRSSNQSGGTALPAAVLKLGGDVLLMEDVEIQPNERVTILVTASISQVLTVNWKWEEYPHR